LNSLQNMTGKEGCVLASSVPRHSTRDRGLTVRTMIASLLSVHAVPKEVRITRLQFPYRQGIGDRLDVPVDLCGIRLLSGLLSIFLQELRLTTRMVGSEGREEDLPLSLLDTFHVGRGLLTSRMKVNTDIDLQSGQSTKSSSSETEMQVIEPSERMALH
jgi:hypothetical protein